MYVKALLICRRGKLCVWEVGESHKFVIEQVLTSYHKRNCFDFDNEQNCEMPQLAWAIMANVAWAGKEKAHETFNFRLWIHYSIISTVDVVSWCDDDAFMLNVLCMWVMLRNLLKIMAQFRIFKLLYVYARHSIAWHCEASLWLTRIKHNNDPQIVFKEKMNQISARASSNQVHK